MDQSPKHNNTIADKPVLVEESEDTTLKPSLEELKEMVKAFAPILCFQNVLNALPGNVEWYLQKSWLVNDTAATRTVAWNNLSYFDDGARYYLQLKEGVTRDSYKIVPRAYVRAKNHNNTHTDLQYWFFYPFNDPAALKVKWLIDGIKGHEGKIDLNPLGTAEGTWQHLTVRINDVTQEAENYFFPQHEENPWLSSSEVKRVKNQVLVYVSNNMGSFNPSKGIKSSAKMTFDLHSSELEFYYEHEMGDVRSCDFSLFSNLVSVDYLPDYLPPECSWLNFNHHWSKRPDYLTLSNLKQILHNGFGKRFEFLLSRDVVNELSNTLLSQNIEKHKQSSLSPKFTSYW
ncbi:MAG: Vps62-related protein [Bacteroidia bacterium]|nr:Vps62-related protein [Bacteroidia bacterium]